MELSGGQSVTHYTLGCSVEKKIRKIVMMIAIQAIAFPMMIRFANRGRLCFLAKPGDHGRAHALEW